MDKVLNTREIAERFGQVVLKTEVEWDEKFGYLRGRLESGRPASIRVREDEEGMLHAVVGVPGGGGLGLQMQFWADEATEQKVGRFVQYFTKRHAKALAAWKIEQAKYV